MSRYCIVVDANYIYRTVVIVESEDNGSDTIQYYHLKEGEQLIDTAPPITKRHAGCPGLVKPKWDDGTASWVEAATESEISAWEAEHPAPMVDLNAEKVRRIAQSKADLAAYLESHPIQWTDGERYSITAEKQQQLTGKILSATLAQQTTTPYDLTWNSTGQVCKEWTLEELGKLAFAIDARVTALVTYQQVQEVAMRDAESLEALAAIEVNYDAVE